MAPPWRRRGAMYMAPLWRHFGATTILTAMSAHKRALASGGGGANANADGRRRRRRVTDADNLKPSQTV